MPDDEVRVKLNALGDHDLLVEHGVTLAHLVEAQERFLALSEKKFSQVDKLEGQVKAVWFILGGGGLLGATIAGLLALFGRGKP